MTTQSNSISKRLRPESLPSSVYSVESPDGKMYVTIVEIEEGIPYEVIIQVGKAGLPLRAWCEALSNLITRHLQNGTGLDKIIQDVSGLGSDRIKRLANGSIVKSSPDALAYVLMSYIRDKNKGENGMFEYGDLSG